MTFKKLLLILFFSLLIMNPAHAQENLPAVIDAADIFSDVVEVVETLPLYIADEEQVSFYDYETEAWETYPYPDFPLEEGEVADPYFVEYPDNSFWLGVSYHVPCVDDCGYGGESGESEPLPVAEEARSRWHFDPDTGAFTAPETICEGYVRELFRRGAWVVVPSGDEAYLCNTETGQTSDLMPASALSSASPFLNYRSMSDDGRWLIFAFYDSYSLYAYDFVENVVIPLGTLESEGSLSRSASPNVYWVDDDHIMLIYGIENFGYERNYLYRATVSQADSIEVVYESSHRYAFNSDDFSRYVWIGNQFDDTPMWGTPPPPEEDCVIHEYNPLDETITSYSIANVCTYGWRIADGSGDRLTVRFPYNENEKFLVRFNLATGTSEEIYIGSYEDIRLERISPDGRYAPIVVDLGGADYQLAIFDLQTSTLLEPQYPADQYTYVRWLGNRNFYFGQSLFTISDTGVSIHEGQFTVLGDGNTVDDPFLFVNGEVGTLSILDIETLETITLAQTPNGEPISASWYAEGLLTVTVWQEGEAFGRWLVRLNL